MKTYDNGKPSKYSTYLDANNFFGWAMSQHLPYREFKWLNREEIDKSDVNLISENSSQGYILEVDLEYHDKLHSLHNDYPLAPEKLEIGYHTLSKYYSNIVDRYDLKVGGVNKLQIWIIKVNLFFATEACNYICH